MDNVGRQIRMRLKPDGKVSVRMTDGKVAELRPVDAREALETGRGKLFGPALNPTLENVARVKRELTEEEIVEEIEEVGAAVNKSLDAQRAPQRPAPQVARPRVPAAPAPASVEG